MYKLVILFLGIGYGMFLVSFFVGIYYTMVIAWAFYYTFASFAKDVPWRYCTNEWNTPGDASLRSNALLPFPDRQI